MDTRTIQRKSVKPGGDLPFRHNEDSRNVDALLHHQLGGLRHHGGNIRAWNHTRKRLLAWRDMLLDLLDNFGLNFGLEEIVRGRKVLVFLDHLVRNLSDPSLHLAGKERSGLRRVTKRASQGSPMQLFLNLR